MPRIGGLIAAGPQRSKVSRGRRLSAGRNGRIGIETGIKTGVEPEQTSRIGVGMPEISLFFPLHEPERYSCD